MKVIYSDVCQWTKNVKSRGGNIGFVIFMEAESLKSWVRFIKNKKEATILENFKSVLKMMERQANQKLIVFHHDDGTEYNASDIFCQEKGIQVRESAAYAKQQNGAAERLNRTLIERGKAALKASGLPEDM